jgi:hypothetical protein
MSRRTRAGRRLIKFNRYRDAYTKTPAEQVELDWPALCDRLERLAKTMAKPGDPIQRKKELPAWTAAEMSEAYNNDANTVALTALPIDVDSAPEALLEVLEASGLSLFAYASPSDPNPDGTRRLRIVAELSRPIAPGEVEHARLALAEYLGIGPGQGVESAKAASQVMFAGRLHGTPVRECWRFDGEALDVAELMATPLEQPWKRASKAKAAPALDRIGREDPDERTAALLEALAEHWEAPGEATDRRSVLRALGGYLARRGWTDDQIAAVGRGLETERPERDRVALMVECARATRDSDGETGAGWSGLTAWSPAGAALIEAHAKDPAEPDGWQGIWSPAWRGLTLGFTKAMAERDARRATPDPLKTAGTAASSKPILLRSREDAGFLLIWEGDARGYRKVAEKNLLLRARELGYLGTLIDPKHADLSPDKLVAEYGATYLYTTHAFANAVTQYDPAGEGRVTVGYPNASLEPLFNADADAWLRALGGEHYQNLAEWIASCAQASIDRLAACLILVGQADSGKSMFSHAVALMWHAKPARAKLLVKQFNGALLRSPIVVDEESQLFGSRELDTKTFRDLIQASARSIEPKNKEEIELIGGLRLVVPCNEIGDLRFADVSGPSVVKAVSDRILLIDATARAEACRAPLDRLRLEGKYTVDLVAVAQHMAWLCETVELPAERFLGSGGADSETAILAGHLAADPEVWESLRVWRDHGADAGPWYALHGGLVVDDRALAELIAESGRGYSLERVRRALEPVADGVRYQARLANGERARVIPLDYTRLSRAMPDLGPLARTPRKGMGGLK